MMLAYSHKYINFSNNYKAVQNIYSDKFLKICGAILNYSNGSSLAEWHNIYIA